MTLKDSERGVILIMVSIFTVVLLALASFAVDYGQAWYARSEAQRTADAGALAGAVAIALEDRTWPFPSGGDVEDASRVVAQLSANSVLSSAMTPSTVDVVPACPVWMAAPNNVNCVRVNVYRDGAHGNAFNTLFANLFGVATQSVRATATAQVAAANLSGCMRPWFIVDEYTDVAPFGEWGGGDTYTQPGYHLPEDLGKDVYFHRNTAPSAYGQLDVGSGGSAIRDAIKYCASGVSFTIGDQADTKPGGTVGPERQGVDSLFDWDAGAYYDATTHTVKGSCADTLSCVCGGETCAYGGTMSPRIVQAAICAPTENACVGKGGKITIINILSFFIVEKMNGDGDIHARLIATAGSQTPGGGTVPLDESFLYVISLVQ